MASNSNRVQEKLSSTVADWKRPDGPLNVWRTVLSSRDGQTLLCTIQEIPKDRYDEAIQHMCDYFLKDEVTCKALNLKNDKAAIEGFRQVWRYILRQEMSVGAYVYMQDCEYCKDIGPLVGLNLLYVTCDSVNNALANFTAKFKSPKAKMLFEFMQKISEKVNVYKTHGVDKYLCGLGCSVNPKYRGYGVGQQMLQVRDEIGYTYGITLSSTIFTGPASQKQARRVGYKTSYSENYSKFLDENGEPLFPNIDATYIMVMTKVLSLDETRLQLITQV